MTDTILITGGAGFIGSHLADELLRQGYRVRVLDNLSEQVHGGRHTPPDYLDPEVEFLHGDVRDRDRVRRALNGVHAVYHFAAAVGVGQSMYQIEKYTDVNNRGTAVLLEALLEIPVEKLVVASSMSLYGEGQYRAPDGRTLDPPERPLAQLETGQWELLDGSGNPLEPVPTPETKQAAPTSVYALSKYDQERLCLMFGRAYQLPVAALRFFNVYGPRQALSNPYTGVIAIFSARYLNDKPPVIFEDGGQQRDFVSVHDVAHACRLALQTSAAAGQVLNIGSGRAYSVADIAECIASALEKPGLPPEITGSYRAGDIRHCFANIERSRRVLGYEPTVDLQQGLAELADWLQGQSTQECFETAQRELTQRGLRL